TYRRARWLFLRALGAIFLGAFISLWVQIDGLIGARGIAPASEFFSAARAQLGASAFRLLPSLYWLGASDAALHGLCAAGCAFALLLVLDAVPSIAAFACWVIYLSLAVAGQDFLSFQWDILLIESGFVAIFLTDPRRLIGGAGAGSPGPARLSIFMMKSLLFRLMLSSG